MVNNSSSESESIFLFNQEIITFVLILIHTEAKIRGNDI